MPSPSLLVFVGPTAVGKTTRAMLLCRRMQGKCRFRVITPFGGLAYLFLKLVVLLVLLAYPGHRGLLGVRKDLAFLEVYFNNLLTKILSVILLLDALTMLLYTLYVVSIVRIAKKRVVLEDYIPQALTDHVAYSLLYLGGLNSSVFSQISTRILYGASKILSSKCMCVLLKARREVVAERAKRRGERRESIGGFYNYYLRTVVVAKTCRQLGCGLVEFFTGTV